MSKLALLHGITLSLPGDYNTLSEMLLDCANKYPNNGMMFFDYKGNEEFLSYPELIKQALHFLNGLQQKGLKPGDILLIEINDPKQFYTVFWACMFGGIVAAPVTQPASFEPGSDKLNKLFNVWETLHKPVILIEEKYRDSYQLLKDSSLHPNFQFFTTNDLSSTTPGVLYKGNFNDLAVLQFSSGSTGAPKGVQLTHKNIITNIFSMSTIFQLTPETNTFSWLPHTHDMGLFCLYLTSVITGCTISICTPSTFIRSPYIFLKKISEHKGTWFGAPNFAFDWMVRKIPSKQLETLDLSCLKFVLNGAEPISISVTQRFIEKFSACGFNEYMMCPAYGMAEATLGVSVAKKTEPLKTARFVRSAFINENKVVRAGNEPVANCMEFMHVGYPNYNMNIRITDAEGNTLEENLLGEIQIQGDSVTCGYYNYDNELHQTFDNGWLHTGDLGFITDGALVVAGRMKDIIFVRGQNYFANDLEEIIYSMGLFQRGCVACVGLFNDKTQAEELLVFITHKAGIERFLPIRKQIINKMLDALGLEITHVVPVSVIPKTTSGKLQLYYLRTCYMNGDYDEVLAGIRQALVEENTNPSSIPEHELENSLRTIWSRLLQIPVQKIAIDDTFYSLGGNSIKAYQLLDEMEQALNREIDPEILVRCKTIRQCMGYLTNSIDRDLPRASNSSQVPSAIAITGMALRFPNARNQHEFWENLRTQKDCITKVSSKRKELAEAPEWDDWLGELDGIDHFDNDFFEISEEEAIFMDPQQRQVLEVSYEALEDAGVLTGLQNEQDIGVYSGVTANSYFQLMIKNLEKHGMEHLHQNSLIGIMSNMISAQIARFYNFTGPALTIDTACSSFLVAFHHAVEALQRNELSGAVVVSANLLVTPAIHLLSHKAGILSSNKHAKVFDKDADGSVLGEGVVVFYLEPLEKALTQNKHIYAVVRGSAINNDGTSFAVMAPNPKGQFKVLQDAYAKANLSPNEIDYIEVHGTGTTIGDPIEMYSLSKLFAGHCKSKLNEIAIGSVKTNIGHLLPAAGGAGLAKILLCMKHKKLVPSLHLEQVNPALKLEKSPFYIVQKVADWSTKENQSRKAGLSSFGFGGTNAHVVLEEWNNEIKSDKQQEFYLLTCSAKTPQALAAMLEQINNKLNNTKDIDLNNFCFTRNRYRNHHAYRAALVLSENTKNEALYTVTGQSFKRVPAKVAILIGDIKKSKLNYWHNILYQLINLTNQINQVSGVDSGAALADLLTTELMLKKESTCKNNWSSDLNNDIIISIGCSQLNCEQAKVIHIEREQIHSSEFQLRAMMAELYVLGVDLHWDLIHPNGSGTLMNLPAYPFKQKSFWINSLIGK